MRYLFLANGRMGGDILRWLVERREPPIGLVVHPWARSRLRPEMIEIAGVSPAQVFEGDTLGDPSVRDAIRALEPDLGLSVMFGYILREDFLALFPRGCLNLHPSFLPYNRGPYPNVWSIVDGTPAGATLHYIDAGIDTGDIVGQRQVPVLPSDTGASLYRKLEDAGVELFRELWPLVATGSAPRRPQPADGGTYHRIRDVDQIDAVDLNRTYVARDLINVLRARTFPPHRGAYFVDGNRRIYMRLELEDEIEAADPMEIRDATHAR